MTPPATSSLYAEHHRYILTKPHAKPPIKEFYFAYTTQIYAILFCEEIIFVTTKESSRISTMSHKPSMDPRLFRRISEKKQKLDAYRPLNPDTVRRLHEDFRVRFTYNSNAIEGNTLSLAETRMIIQDGLTVEGHTIRELLEATNHAEAYDALDTLVKHDITLETILQLHGLIMDKLLQKPGALRTEPVYITGSSYTPPPARDVPGYMMQWVRWLTSTEAYLYDTITRTAIAHHGFEAVHPFTDGNGRTGRLLMNLMLIRDGYPPALILREWRGRYIAALQNAHQGDYNPLINIVGVGVEYSLDIYLEACESSTTDLIPLKALAEIYEMDNNYLGQLARMGKLDAIKRGTFWYATREAIETYLHEVQVQPRGRRKMQ